MCFFFFSLKRSSLTELMAFLSLSFSPWGNRGGHLVGFEKQKKNSHAAVVLIGCGGWLSPFW
jgi:hypothetical protein